MIGPNGPGAARSDGFGGLFTGIILLIGLGFFFGFLVGLLYGHDMGLTDHASGQWKCQLATKQDQTTAWVCTKAKTP